MSVKDDKVSVKGNRMQAIPGKEEGSDMTDHAKNMTPEEIIAAAKEEGYELTDDELESIAAGGEWKNDCCPNCGHTGTMYCPGTGVSRCGKCGNTW